MTVKKRTLTASALRERAEGSVGTAEDTSYETMSLEQIQCLCHELKIHTIELEMQNEELLQAQRQLECQGKR